ncbi:MAG: SMC family ATPase [Gemmatimonadetes bacterium]|nr:SMC family ATPase [Gemmatimonadota bacterium]
MRPLGISIEGLRSFRAEVKIDFGHRTQIAVIGDTGAGKSSILEAMTYALYGQTSVGGRSKQELMNDTSDTMRVVLRFRVAGQEWEVTRVDRKAGAGGLRPARAQLVCFGPGGETLEKVEQVRQVNDRIEALIGLDSDAFLRTVVLPQGRFARLLVEDKPRDRTEILRQVWRTHDLEAAGESVGRQLQQVRTLEARLQDGVARWPDDPKQHLGRLTELSDKTARHAQALARLRERAEHARDTLRQSDAVIAAAQRVDATVAPEAMDKLAARLALVAESRLRIDADQAELESRHTNLKRDLNSIPTDDGPDHQAVAQALAALDAFPEQAERAVESAATLRALIADEATAGRNADSSLRTLEAANDRLARHSVREAPLGDAVKSARDRLTGVEVLYEKCGELLNRLLAARGERARRREEIADTAARLATAATDEGRAKDEAGRAAAALAAAQRGNAAAAAAHGLHAGDECPVCWRDLPAGWTAPPDQGLDAAQQALEAARSRVRDASRTAVGLKAREESARQMIADLEKALEERGSETSAAWERLRSAAGLEEPVARAGDEPLPDREQTLAPVRRRLRDAEARLDEHGKEAASLIDAQKRALIDENSARQSLKHARRQIRTTREAVQSAVDGLNRNLRSIPSLFRPRLALPSDPVELDTVDTTSVDRALYAVREREAILRQREQERDRLRTGIEEARTALKRIGETARTEVEAPLQTMVRAVGDQRAALADAVRSLSSESSSYGSGSPFPDIAIPTALYYPVETDALRDGIDRLREAMAETLTRAGDLRRGAIAAADEARKEAGRIAGQLDPSADATDLDALARHAATLADDARYSARDAQRARDAFAAVLDDVLELRNTADEVAALELALGDLDASLKPGAFLKWLTLRRSRDLLVYASRMLVEMTGGRYAFADPGDHEDQEWLVVDSDSGEARSPASLSGGEQFIGSLALALGMVEMMARSGGRLESLFLDEGFGSLDRSNLDSAIEALSTVSGKGRMVGVISHVAAVAEQIDDVLAVTRTVAGSRVTWLSRSQRHELARGDTGLEGASALAGLLE